MKTQFKHPINYFAILLAIGSFFIGTLLLVMFQITASDDLLVTGLLYVYLAVFINTLMLIFLCINAITHIKDYRENLLTILGVLLNIPITLFYIDIVF